jgi:hypothetical protein
MQQMLTERERNLARLLHASLDLIATYMAQEAVPPGAEDPRPHWTWLFDQGEDALREMGFEMLNCRGGYRPPPP